jgi:hypothetical protein
MGNDPRIQGDASATVAADLQRQAEIPTQGQDTEEDFARRLAALRPDAQRPAHRLRNLIGDAIIAFVLLGAVGMVLLAVYGQRTGGSLRLFDGLFRAQITTRIASTHDSFALLLAGSVESGSEVKLIDQANGQVLDLTSGVATATHVGLDPQGTSVAIATASSGGSGLVLRRLAGGTDTIFEAAALTAAAQSLPNWTAARICDWSTLDWSADGATIAFFACGAQGSALFTVTAAPNTAPHYVVDSLVEYSDARTGGWLGATTYAFAGGKAGPTTVYAVNTAQGTLNRLYGAP